ncbi:MAG: HAMP domain-containing histidine kinase [Acidimicrobiales bacterium]|nr:HAMP domain-containing histidine kinase [Acidimicrobiales bacterium]MCB9395774.1 HAMP domain-containing histidine kinase [Acidimicrobiaceae bacterium]
MTAVGARGRSLRTRVVAVAAASAALLVAVAALLVVHRDWRLADTVLIDDVMDTADEQDRVAAGQYDDGDPLTIEVADDDLAIGRYTVDGGLDEVTGPLGRSDLRDIGDELEIDLLDPLDVVGDELEIDGRRWAVAATACIEPAACGGFVVARPFPSYVDHLRDRLGWIVGLVLLGAAVVALAARWAVGRSLRAVDLMRREVDEITAADLSRRVPVPSSGDELEQLARSFNATIERLERGVGAQRRFVNDAAHELRSPLTGVRAVLEVAQRRPDQMAVSVDAAVEQVDRAARLVDDLLVLARHDGAATPPRRRVVDLDDLVRSEARALADRSPGVTVDRSQVQPVQTSLDDVAIARVVQNLLDNAAAHAAATVRVSLGVVPVGDAAGRSVLHWELRVDDDGRGVPVADRERVFERFARLDDARSRERGGTGLGLAIVRELVAEHGGTVAVGDADLGGASFVVRVPLPLSG